MSDCEWFRFHQSSRHCGCFCPAKIPQRPGLAIKYYLKGVPPRCTHSPGRYVTCYRWQSARADALAKRVEELEAAAAQEPPTSDAVTILYRRYANTPQREAELEEARRELAEEDAAQVREAMR